MITISDVFRDEAKHPNKSLRFSLPIPPSVNKLYYNTRGGGKRLTSQAENYIRISRPLINLAVEEQRWVKPTKHTWLYVDLVFYMPDRRVRDASNCLKILLDVLQGIVFHNDYICLPRIQSVEYDKENPRCDVFIRPQIKMDREYGLKITC